MPRPVAVLRLVAGTNTRGLTPWFIVIRPSIIFETAAFVIWRYLENPLALSLGKRDKCSDVMMDDATPRSGVGASIWYPYGACHRTLVRRYSTLHHLRTSCFRDFADMYRESPCFQPYRARSAWI